MNKELQDLTWRALPKEFKEEVKKLYSRFLFTREGYYDELFGKHNLTSDAEGEDMLTVSRKRVQELYSSYCTERDEEEPRSNRSSLGGRIAMLQELFGSKCLQDEPETNCHHLQDPKPVEPKDESPVIIDCDKCSEQGKCDRLIKRVLLDQKRLHIAAMAMQGLLASPVDANMQSKSVDYITDASFEYADALISKNKKGGQNENN